MEELGCRGTNVEVAVYHTGTMLVNRALHDTKRKMIRKRLAKIVNAVDLDVFVRPFGRQGHVLKERSQHKRPRF
jgi:hypothetical protein